MSKTLLALAMMTLAGCPTLPPPDGCAPHEMRCHNDVPEVCSPSTRWTPAVDRPCREIGAVCCGTASYRDGRPVMACMPARACSSQDGGV